MNGSDVSQLMLRLAERSHALFEAGQQGLSVTWVS
jgi:hypothetical protein